MKPKKTPVNTSKGNFIADGFSKDLDEHAPSCTPENTS